jgi:acetolactate synthase I/II/III large subunit
LIGVGTRLEMPYMRWTGMMNLIDRPEPPPHLIRIDIDPAEMTRLKPQVGIVADAVDGAVAVTEAIRRRRDNPRQISDEALARIARAKAEAREAITAVQPQIAYLDVIREVLPRDGLLVGELSQVGFASYFGFPAYEPRTYISEGYQGALGFGFPTALGVKAAHPDRPVISVTGDGGFMFAVQELATAAQERIGLITLLFNNQSFGNVLRDQRTAYGDRVIGSKLDNPDFLALARAFGIAAQRVETPQGLKSALSEVLSTRDPVLIEIVVPEGSEVSPWPFIHPKRGE